MSRKKNNHFDWINDSKNIDYHQYSNGYGNEDYPQNQSDFDNYNNAYENDDFHRDDLNYGDNKHRPWYKKKQPINDKKKKAIISSFIMLICAAVIGVSIGLIYRFVIAADNNKSTSSNSNNNNDESDLTKEYMTDDSAVSKAAMQYISERTLSIQFYFSPNNNSKYAQVVSGTGWIFNKDSSSDTYYLATNIHVAAALTFSGNVVTENGDENDFTNYTLTSVYIGFVDISSDDDNVYEQSNLTTLQVSIPTVVYRGDMTSLSYDTKINNGTTYTPMSDFAILKFDFSETSLTSENPTLRSNISSFETWLSYYQDNPTSFVSTPVDFSSTSSTNEFYTRKYYMGGFPGTGTQTDQNPGGTEWAGFANFPIAVNENSPISGSLINESNYLSLASGAYDLDVSQKSAIVNSVEYFDDTTTINYVNAGLYALLDADSAGGASGSMLVVNTGTSDDPSFSVIGIYWGALTFESSSSTTQTVGVANLLNINGYSFSSSYSYSGFDLFYEATQAIINANGSDDLVYSYTSGNSSVNSNTTSNSTTQSYITYFNNTYSVCLNQYLKKKF